MSDQQQLPLAKPARWAITITVERSFDHPDGLGRGWSSVRFENVHLDEAEAYFTVGAMGPGRWVWTDKDGVRWSCRPEEGP